MPLYRKYVSQDSEDTSLERFIAEIEAKGENVVQVTQEAGQWIIVTGKRARETRVAR